MFWLSLLAILEAVQWTAFLSWLLHFVPPPAPLAGIVYPEWQYLLRPEWETTLFRFFVFACIAWMAVFTRVWHKRVSDREFLSRLKWFIVVEGALTFFLMAAFFKITVYALRPDCARMAAGIVAILLVLSKAAGPRFKDMAFSSWRFLAREQNQVHLRRLADAGMIVLVAAFLYMPDPQAVVARMFVGEQFHHNDSFIMGPALAYTTGCVLDADIISQYGIGFVVVISGLVKMLGGLNYLNVLMALMACSIVYYWTWYSVLRRWLVSVPLAAAVLLLGLKWQMFHSSAYPLVFTYGSLTPVRFLYDVAYFLLLWHYLDSGRKLFLFAACAVAGFGIYYFISEGVYATASLYAFVLIIGLAASLRRQYPLRIRERAACVLLPPLMFFVLMALTAGGRVFTAAFWANVGEFIQYFMSGFGLEPIYKTLLERNFLQSLMGFVIPSVYALTVLITGTWVFLGKAAKRDTFALVLCLYGLGTFHYYVARSVVTSYDAVALPFAFIIGYWVKIILEALPVPQARRVSLVFLAAALYALLTNHLFMSYPNILNFSRNPMTDPVVALPLESGKPYFNHLFRDYPQESKLPVNSLGQTDEGIVSEQNFSSDDDLVAYYKKESDFSRDAGLISRLTADNEAVPLISSFEVSILMQAHRRPYFYYFPLAISRPMAMRMFTATSVYTVDQIKKILDKLERDRPAYIFMERIFLSPQVPRAYLFQFPALMVLLDHVRAHYEPVETGKYLVAMKRRE